MSFYPGTKTMSRDAPASALDIVLLNNQRYRFKKQSSIL